MAVQKEAKLDQPLPADAKPVITSTALTPELASAAMNLTLETRLSRQSLLNRRMLSDTRTVSVLALFSASVLGYRLADYFQYVNWRLVIRNIQFWMDVLQNGVFLLTVIAGVFVLLTRNSHFLKDEIEDLKNDTPKYFGLDLETFAKLPTDVKADKYKGDEKLNDLAALAAAASYVQVIEYRSIPIACIAVQREQYGLKISSYGVRRVYVKSGILADLLLWCKFKARAIAKTEGGKCKLVIDMYSFEQYDRNVLAESGFVKTKAESLGSKVLDFFDVQRETWEATVSIPDK